VLLAVASFNNYNNTTIRASSTWLR